MNKTSGIFFSTGNLYKIEVGAVALLFTIGIILHVTHLRSFAIGFTEIFLLVVNTWMLIRLFHVYYSPFMLAWVVLTFVFTYITEVLGVKTGLIFGEYVYGEVMRVKMLQVPLIIALNWVLLILSSYSLAQFLVKKRVFLPVISSVFIVILDYFIEPVAMKLGYWNWINQEVPLQNYLAWFIVSFIFSSLLANRETVIKIPVFRAFFVIQLLFFILLNIIG
ncbi:MAG: carotenoid biosynthesis protein [bacterium]